MCLGLHGLRRWRPFKRKTWATYGYRPKSETVSLGNTYRPFAGSVCNDSPLRRHTQQLWRYINDSVTTTT